MHPLFPPKSFWRRCAQEWATDRKCLAHAGHDQISCTTQVETLCGKDIFLLCMKYTSTKKHDLCLGAIRCYYNKTVTFHAQMWWLIQTTATDFFSREPPQDTHQSLKLEMPLLTPQPLQVPLSFLMQWKHSSGGTLTYHKAQRKYIARRNWLAGNSSNCGTPVTKKV